MQERFEDETIQQQAPLPPIVDYEGERRAMLAFKAFWRKGDHLAVAQTLNGMKSAHILETQTTLCEYVLSPVASQDLQGERRRQSLEGKRIALRLVAASPRGEIVPILVQLLNHSEPVLAQEAATALKNCGKRIVPELLQLYLEPDLKRMGWTEAGLQRFIALLGDLEDRRAVQTLLEIAHGKPVGVMGVHRKGVASAPLVVAAYVVMSFNACLAANLDAGEGWAGFVAVLWVLMTVFFGAAALAGKRQARLSVALARAAIDSLGVIGDKRALPDLCYFVYAGRHKAQVARALHRILPTITEADSLSLRSRELAWLTKALFSCDADFPDLRLRILSALAYLGNTETLGVVERLAERGDSESVRAEAQRVLPILRERLSRIEEKRNLLRASDAPQREYETLLRPYKFAKSEEAEQLLRPADPAE